ncbi:DUF5689 domain-containing protein [uncultured Winogradskyella sp.]|uniref:DUF5689 domain-containing protein n=1 Tax=Winogradskyella sp. 4-2091 TaxID=3381659 RepID=UPI0026351400|nr:DUF5689 domain-containing protein [uncultured Winogradskyella sp.]
MNKTIKLLLVLMASIAITSCVQDDDYDVPTSLGNEENEALNELLARVDNGQDDEIQMKTITEVRALAVQYEAIEIASDIMVKGYVSSSDETGNFYKEFFIQDSPSDPTSTLKVVLNQADTYNQFNQGREVYIYLKDLVIGETNTGDDVITIGGKIDDFDNDVLAMTANQIPSHLFRSSVTETLTPVELNLSEITESHLGMYVKLIDVQFPVGLAGLPYVDPTDDYDSSRPIESCGESATFVMESSTFANFKDITLPTDGKGSIAGIINKTYDGYDLVLQLNTTDDVVMDGVRCDPLFVEAFETDFLTWTNYSVTGAQVWSPNTYGNPGKCAAMSGYAGSNQNNEDWLITPAIDLSSVGGAVLTFQTAMNYTGPVLEVYMSTDYAGGNPNDSGSWTPLSATLSSGSWNWTDSGEIDVSAAAGENLYIAFKYTSTTSGSATYEIDNVKVIAQ